MKQLSILLALLFCLGTAAADINYSSIPPGTAPNPPWEPDDRPDMEPAGVLTYWSDEGLFKSQFPGLTYEDFSEAIVNIGPGNVMACTGALHDETLNECFLPGDIENGMILDNQNGGENVVLTPFFLGVDCVAVGPNTFDHDAVITFDKKVQAFGVHMVCPFGPFTTYIMIYDTLGNMIGETDANCLPIKGYFWGVSTDGLCDLGTIEFSAGVDNGELFCNMQWGHLFPTPAQASSWGRIKSMYTE